MWSVIRGFCVSSLHTVPPQTSEHRAEPSLTTASLPVDSDAGATRRRAATVGAAVTTAALSTHPGHTVHATAADVAGTLRCPTSCWHFIWCGCNRTHRSSSPCLAMCSRGGVPCHAATVVSSWIGSSRNRVSTTSPEDVDERSADVPLAVAAAYHRAVPGSAARHGGYRRDDTRQLNGTVSVRLTVSVYCWLGTGEQVMWAKNFPVAAFGYGAPKGYIRLSCFSQQVQYVVTGCNLAPGVCLAWLTLGDDCTDQGRHG